MQHHAGQKSWAANQSHLDLFQCPTPNERWGRASSGLWWSQGSVSAVWANTLPLAFSSSPWRPWRLTTIPCPCLKPLHLPSLMPTSKPVFQLPLNWELPILEHTPVTSRGTRLVSSFSSTFLPPWPIMPTAREGAQKLNLTAFPNTSELSSFFKKNPWIIYIYIF